ncbi:hypothetical protein GGI00_001086, partial [Coemansia sp. RSA 2681]
ASTEDESSSASAPSKVNRIAALSCGHTFHLECVEEWRSRVASLNCFLCNIRHIGPIIPLFIDFAEELEAKGASLQTRLNEKDKQLKERQATIKELREKVVHLQARESELMTLSKRHKVRMRRLQNMVDILKKSITKADGPARSSDVVNM